MMFVTTSIRRLSTRSTKTPAIAEKMIAGTRKLSSSAPTALFEWYDALMMMVRP